MTLRLLFGHDAAVAAWVGDALGTVIVPPFTAIGVLDVAGTLCGGFVFSSFNGANIEVTAFGARILRRGVLCAVTRYVFVQLGCTRLSATVRRGNKTMRRLMPRLGFRCEGVSPHFYGSRASDDGFRYGMVRRNCKWLRSEDVAFTKSAAAA